jgi:hypothetical protein
VESIVTADKVGKNLKIHSKTCKNNKYKNILALPFDYNLPRDLNGTCEMASVLFF